MVGTVSVGWPFARADKRVVLPEFSKPITTMSRFLVKNTSRSLRSTCPIFVLFAAESDYYCVCSNISSKM